jgi:quercetin dioxygenase-like cupin family protein
MPRRDHVRTGIIGTIGLIVVVGVQAPAQQRELTVGQTKLDRLFTVDLAEVGLQGESAAQRVTIEPGIKTADHTHTGRTSLMVVTQGAFTEVRATGKTEYKAGDVVRVPEGTTHHAENYGTVPVVYVEINTTKKKTQ